MSLSESIETVEIWLDMWSDSQAEVEEVDPSDIEERKVIQAMREVLKEVKPRKPASCVVSPCPLGLGKTK